MSWCSIVLTVNILFNQTEKDKSALHNCKCKKKMYDVLLHVRWVPCHHGMVCPQVAVGGDALQVWRVAANVLNKQLWTADKGWSSSFGVGRGTNNPSP
jgi:hypothetical protein